MKWIQVKNYTEMSQLAARIMTEKIAEKPNATLGLATGGTPEQMYRWLREYSAERQLSFRDVQTFNLDEYIGLGREHPNSYYQYMRTHLFAHIDLPEAHAHLPNGLAADVNAECLRYEALIEQAGGIDLQLLGVGKNGHIGFNEPGTPFTSRTHLVQLTESTRAANACYFSSLEAVPTHAITMGIATITKSKEILLLASGREKANVLAELMRGEVTEELPASVLLNHANATIIADEDALAFSIVAKRK